jgi:glucose-6-phosphate 1-dehydrogenase
MEGRRYADALILFGISGDLAQKKLFSALYDLTATGGLDMPIVGVALSNWDDETLRLRAREALEKAGELNTSMMRCLPGWPPTSVTWPGTTGIRRLSAT